MQMSLRRSSYIIQNRPLGDQRNPYYFLSILDCGRSAEETQSRFLGKWAEPCMGSIRGKGGGGLFTYVLNKAVYQDHTTHYVILWTNMARWSDCWTETSRAESSVGKQK